MLYVILNGASAEITMVGNEGIIGVGLSWVAQPCLIGRRVERGLRLSAAGHLLMQEFDRFGDVATEATRFVTALYPYAYYPDSANGSLQSASFGGSATLPLAAYVPRPAPFERVNHDPGMIANMLACAVKASRRPQGNCSDLD